MQRESSQTLSSARARTLKKDSRVYTQLDCMCVGRLMEGGGGRGVSLPRIPGLCPRMNLAGRVYERVRPFVRFADQGSKARIQMHLQRIPFILS